MLDVVAGALRRAADRDRLVLEVNPDDFELVRDAIDGARRAARRHRPHRRRRRAPRRAAAAASSAPSEGEIDARVDRAARARRRARPRRARGRADRRCLTPRPLGRARRALADADLQRRRGRVTNLIGLVIEATGLRAEVGELCTIAGGRNRAAGPRRGGRLPRRPHAADAARRACAGSARARRSTPTGGPFRVPVGDDAARPRARRARPPDRRRPRDLAAAEPRADRPARRPSPLAAPRIDRAARARRARARHARALRPRPAPRHLRRLRRRQVDRCSA